MSTQEDKGADITSMRGGDRRQYGRLTPEEVEWIKDEILKSVYEEIGRSLVKKFLWIVGAIVAGVMAGLAATGKIQLK